MVDDGGPGRELEERMEMKTKITIKGAQDTDRVLTVPNAVTVLRLLLLFPVCWFILTDRIDINTLILLGVWASTDWVDGLLARLLKQRSALGKMLDPLTDRVGIALVLACLTIAGIVPWGLVAAVVITDAAAAAFVGRAALGGRVGVTWLGKIRTGLMFVGIVGLLVGELVPALDTPAYVLMLLAVVLHVVVGISYVVAAHRTRVRS